MSAAPGPAGPPAHGRPAGPPAHGPLPHRDSEVELFSLAGHDGLLRQVNARFERLLGVAPGAAEGRSLLEFVHPEDLAHVVEGFFLLEQGAAEVVLDTRFLVADRSVVHLQWVARPVPDSQLWWAAGRDVTEFHRAATASVDLRARLSLAVGSASAAMWDLDPWTQTFTWEDEAAEVLGVAGDAVPATTADLLALADTADRAALAVTIEQLRAGATTVEADFRTGDAPDTRHLRLRGRSLDLDRRGRGRRAVGLVLDVSAEKALQEQMMTLVMSDALTGVPNRRAFDQRLRAALRAGVAEGRPVTVAMVDIDDFKLFNDTFGHLVGDDVLCTVSRALTSVVDPTGMLARFGGEEFAAVLPGVDARAARCVGRDVVLGIRATRLRQAPDWPLTVSVGTATWQPGDPQTRPADLLGRADRALYRAKAAGKDRTEHGVVEAGAA